MSSTLHKRTSVGKVIRAWMMFRAERMEGSEDWESLKGLAQSWIRLNNDAEAWYLLGIAQGRLGNAESEIEAYVSSLELHPAAAGVWNNLGATYLDLERYQDAAKAYEKALELTPSDPNVYEGLVVTYSHLQRHDDAQKTIRALIDLGERAILSGWHKPELGLEVYAALRRLDPAFEKLLVDRVSPVLEKLAK
jgi:tetratricopeptide (TPR) repeat protein